MFTKERIVSFSIYNTDDTLNNEVQVSENYIPSIWYTMIRGL